MLNLLQLKIKSFNKAKIHFINSLNLISSAFLCLCFESLDKSYQILAKMTMNQHYTSIKQTKFIYRNICVFS
jgi:hypothetical protein